MLIVSQNITNYGLSMPKNAVFRINLAWVNSISDLEILLKSHQNHPIFLDLPINRTKPPNNKYTLEEIIEEVASTRVTERGGRSDDKRSEAAMEDRKKEGYF